MSTRHQSSWRALAGNLAVGALLLAVALALSALQPFDAWWRSPPLPQRWQWAAISIALYLLLCGGIIWRHRRSDGGSASKHASGPAPWLVAWASQTGLARQLAERTAERLRAAGQPARLCALEQIDADTLATTGRALFIASTTGEGDAPDHALAFLRHAMEAPQSLPQLHYAVLALGDRNYTHYCGFGRQLDDWLHRQGAQPLFPRIDVDNADTGALQRWQGLVGTLAGQADTDAWEPPAFGHWRLARRRELNPGAFNGSVFALELQPLDGPLPDWQAGDIAEIAPRHATAAIEVWLAEAAQDGDARVSSADGSGDEPLRQRLASSQLPPARECVRLPMQALAERLIPLPVREYSIASIPANGSLDLLVRSVSSPDGQPGLGSGWLCRHAALQGEIALRIRPNPNFHPPADDTPMILIGNGTGIAGLRAHLLARAARGARRNWLLFGERHAATDFYYGEQIRAWRASGLIERIDLAFSRDAANVRYVQHALLEAADPLRRWIADGAAIYVCGSLQGMAPGVDEVLDAVFGADAREQLLMAGRYRRDVY